MSVFLIFLLSSVNVDSSSSVNDGGMIFSNLPSVNVGSASIVNVGVSYLFAIISERW